MLRTPNHPECPCGHCIGAAVEATILAAKVPRPPCPFTTDQTPGASYVEASWDDYVRDMSMSRIIAGVHFRYSAYAANAMGRTIGAKALTSMRPL